jgi:UDP-glucose 4-epimerase
MGYILVTGGLGFIGSHVVVELLQRGHNVVIIDNLCNSQVSVLDRIRQLCPHNECILVEKDLCDFSAISDVFGKYEIDWVIHMAGLKAVSESISQPLQYYSNNLIGTLNLLNVMKTSCCNKIIFSSSATVYGNGNYPVDEEAPTGVGITNPYGQTKFMIEQMLQDLGQAEPHWTIVIFRYFNPVGQHPSGLLPENPNGPPNNLFPHVLKSALNGTTLTVHGDNYATVDGTCIRDFIHVTDLAQGHICAIGKVKDSGVKIYNLGTGQGTTVLQLINQFEQTNAVKINRKVGPARQGDLPIAFALVDKAKKDLGWKTEKTLTDICRDGYRNI